MTFNQALRLGQKSRDQINEERNIRSSIGSNQTWSSDGTLIGDENGVEKLKVKLGDSRTDKLENFKIVITDVDHDSDEDVVTRIDSKKDSGFGSQGILKVDKFKVSSINFSTKLFRPSNIPYKDELS